MIASPNLKVGNDWRGTLNVAFAIIRRTRFAIYSQAETPEDGDTLIYNSQTGEFDFQAEPTYSPVQVDSLVQTGWIPLSAAGTYVSASSFTIAGDFTSYVQKFDKIKLTNSTVKYGHVAAISVAAGITTITIVVNTDYVLTNVAITDIYFSRVLNPYGFPGGFNYAPTYTGFSVNPSSVGARYTITGNLCTTAIRMNVAGTSNANFFTVSAAVVAATITNAYWGTAQWSTVNGGATLTTPGTVYISSAGTAFQLQSDMGSGVWNIAGAKRSDFVITHEI